MGSNPIANRFAPPPRRPPVTSGCLLLADPKMREPSAGVRLRESTKICPHQESNLGCRGHNATS